MKQKSKPFRVLSLDGGGMRGTYTTTYLARVANAFAIRRGVSALDIGAAFDLIVGTSTGGIVACALAAGIPLSEITALYVKHGPMIFTRPMPRGFLGVAGDITKRPQALAKGRAALRRALDRRFGKTTLRDIYTARGIALAIPTTEIGQHRGLGLQDTAPEGHDESPRRSLHPRRRVPCDHGRANLSFDGRG